MRDTGNCHALAVVSSAFALELGYRLAILAANLLYKYEMPKFLSLLQNAFVLTTLLHV